MKDVVKQEVKAANKKAVKACRNEGKVKCKRYDILLIGMDNSGISWLKHDLTANTSLTIDSAGKVRSVDCPNDFKFTGGVFR